jgi:copper oxidase (laccase) domain-containing protein
VAEACTLHEEGWFSHRRDATTERLAAVGWL